MKKIDEHEQIKKNVRAIDEWCKDYILNSGITHTIFLHEIIVDSWGIEYGVIVCDEGITIYHKHSYSPTWYAVNGDSKHKDLLTKKDVCRSLVLNWKRVKADIIRVCEEVKARQKAIYEFEV